jgi:hypothetical protein
VEGNGREVQEAHGVIIVQIHGLERGVLAAIVEGTILMAHVDGEGRMTAVHQAAVLDRNPLKQCRHLIPCPLFM